MRGARVALGIAGLALLAAACGPRVTPAIDVEPPTVPVAAPNTSPTLTGLACPVVGAVWGDGFGPRGTGFHSGVDLSKPLRSPEYAVRAGRVHYVANEAGGGGNVVYLTGNDGNVYYYAHLNDFVGVDRTVTQNEIIGHVGMTGNATGPHLHFGIRLGGANGTRIDPAPSLHAISC
jgi:murein DD-endopeptidase MepM/ murein hydrolase activator NlpD